MLQAEALPAEGASMMSADRLAALAIDRRAGHELELGIGDRQCVAVAAWQNVMRQFPGMKPRVQRT